MNRIVVAPLVFGRSAASSSRRTRPGPIDTGSINCFSPARASSPNPGTTPP